MVSCRAQYQAHRYRSIGSDILLQMTEDYREHSSKVGFKKGYKVPAGQSALAAFPANHCKIMQHRNREVLTGVLAFYVLQCTI